jgi:uncharacterized protein (TIGR02118 family)
VAVWRLASSSAEQFRSALVAEWTPLALDHEGLDDLSLNFAAADQGIYTRTPGADGLTSTVDGFMMLGLARAHDLDDLPGRDELYRLARRVDVWRVRTERPKSYARTWPDGTEAPGVKLVSFMRRAEAMNHEQFVRHWSERHTPLALEHHVGLWDYRQHVVRRAYTPGGRDVDGIAELHFETRADFDEKFFDSDAGRKVIMDDVARFMGRPTGGSGLMVELPILTAFDGRGAVRPGRLVE